MYSPAEGHVSSEFGWRGALNKHIGAMLHAGIDIANSTGTPIFAAFAGTVVKAGHAVVSGRSGNGILIRNPDGEHQYYGHLSKVLVGVGNVVSKGTKIGEMGATGNVTGPHLHFETWANSSSNSVRNPREWFNKYHITPGERPEGAKPTAEEMAKFKEYVTKQQTHLSKTRHYTGAIDGEFGKMTLAAVKTFQEDYGLISDGTWGAQTDSMMSDVLNMKTSPDLSQDGSEGTLTTVAEQWALDAAGVFSDERIDGHRGPAHTAAEQLLLNKGGWYQGPIDGAFTEESVKAEQRFLKYIGYYNGDITGVRDVATIRALQGALRDGKFTVVPAPTDLAPTPPTPNEPQEAPKETNPATSPAQPSTDGQALVTFARAEDGTIYRVNELSGTYSAIPNWPAYLEMQEHLANAKIPFRNISVKSEELAALGIKIG